MKWDFEEGLKEREYPESGTVTISTKEYRDLIKDVSVWFAKAKAEHDKYMNTWCRQNDLENEVATFNSYFEEHSDIYVEFLEWKKDRETD